MGKKKEKEAIILDVSLFESRMNKKKKILDDLDALDATPSFVSVSKLKKKNDEIKKKEDKNEEEKIADDWLSMVNNFKEEPFISRKRTSGVFEPYYENGKKKKKKKKKNGELTDFNREFELESRFLKNLLEDQNKFVNTLQQRCNAMFDTKSAARGVGKFTTDMIAALNQARSLSKDLVKEQIALKKNIADLHMKEKKEFGQSMAMNGEDMSAYSSKLLQEMINGRSAIRSMDGVDIPEQETDINDFFDAVADNLGEQSDEVDTYLKYENSDITIYACIDKSTGESYFEAHDGDDNVVPDYPCPPMTKLNINQSTNIASDIYSEKYPIIWV